VPLVLSIASISLLVVGAGRGTLLLSGSEAAMVRAEGGCRVASGGVSAVPGAGQGSLVLQQGSPHLAGEVLYFLQKCGVVGGWTNASKHQLGCNLGDVVCTAGCGIQAAPILNGENGLYVGG
jgi:hypothetical protein